MLWHDFEFDGTQYKLDHLHPMSFVCTVPANDRKPEQHITVNVVYSLHCFTRSSKPHEAIPQKLSYSDSREVRIFDFRRYELSKTLPDIISNISENKCFHNRSGSFMFFRVTDDNGAEKEYTIFFTMGKVGNAVNMYINTAHERPLTGKKKKPIRFRVIARNTFHGKKISIQN